MRLYTISVDIETVGVAAPTTSITAFDVVEITMAGDAETFRRLAYPVIKFARFYS